MDRHEKKRLRDHIGEHLDVSNARLTDDEASFLGDFIDTYDEKYKGHTETRTKSHDGWSSDGKFTRKEIVTDTYNDEVGIRRTTNTGTTTARAAHRRERSRTPAGS